VAKNHFIEMEKTQFEPLMKGIKKVIAPLGLESTADEVKSMKSLDTKLVTLRARLFSKMNAVGLGSLLSLCQKHFC